MILSRTSTYPNYPDASHRSYKLSIVNEAQGRGTLYQGPRCADKRDYAGHLPHRRGGFSYSIYETYWSVGCFTSPLSPLHEMLNYLLRVQMDLQHLRFKLESKMPRNLKRPSTLNIDHSRLLIGSSEEGYMARIARVFLLHVLTYFSAIDRKNLAKGSEYYAKNRPSLRGACFYCSASPWWW